MILFFPKKLTNQHPKRAFYGIETQLKTTKDFTTSGDGLILVIKCTVEPPAGCALLGGMPLQRGPGG